MNCLILQIAFKSVKWSYQVMEPTLKDNDTKFVVLKKQMRLVANQSHLLEQRSRNLEQVSAPCRNVEQVIKYLWSHGVSCMLSQLMTLKMT